MKSIELKGTIREKLGKASSKTIRAAENVPCILYGGKSSVYFSVIEKDLKHILYTPHVYLINLNVNGQTHVAKIQDIQFHPVSDAVNHIDFYEVSDDKEIIIDLPVIVTGNSVGVREGGKLIQDKRKVKVKGLVKNIPDEISIDISEIGIGENIKVGDLEHKNLEFLDLKHTPVVSVKVTRIAKAAEETAGTPATAAAPATPAPAATTSAPAKAAPAKG
jgi:large subunit ribosomal protein L25